MPQHERSFCFAGTSLLNSKRIKRLAPLTVSSNSAGQSGNGGGGCELHGKKIFFLDLALDPAEQLDSVIDTLSQDGNALKLLMPHQLRELLAVRKSA
ncbi:MAG: hypothetical protein ABSG67_19665 [Thermoguttaceae bacterium]